METPENEPVEELENVTEDPQPGQDDVQESPEDNSSQPDQVPDDGWRKYAEQRAAERQREQERQAKEREQAEELKRIQRLLGLEETPQETAQEKKERLESLKDIDVPTGTDVESYVMSILEKHDREREERKERERREREQKEYPNMLQRDFPDVNDVLTQENVDYLSYHHPEIAGLYEQLPDGYDKYSKLYSTIKRLVPQTRSRETERAKANLSKPQATHSGSAAPASDTRGGYLSEAQKRANYERMMREMGKL